jgi:glycopeptide antibiotics resistance protein
MIDQVRRLAPLLPFALSAIVVGVVVAWLAARGRPRDLRRMIVDASLVAAAAAALVLTLAPAEPPSDRRLDLVPFRELQPVGYDHPSALLEMTGNVLLFAPIGSLVALRLPRVRSLGMAAIVGAVASTAVEVAQYVMDQGREASVTDVLLNTAGVMLGFVFARALVARRRSSRTAVHA